MLWQDAISKPFWSSKTAMRETDILIFGGQSNMQGQTEALSEAEIVNNADEYRFLSDTLVPLRNPVGENIRYDGGEGETFTETCDPAAWLAAHALGSACYGHTNLVPAFCRAYLGTTGGQAVAVHAAKGSTEVRDWLPGTKGYDMLIRKARAAISKVTAEAVVGKIYFIWLQGESDAIFSNPKDEYKHQLARLGEALALDLCIDRFGVIRVGHFTGDARDDEIISAQDELCRENPCFLMLTELATQLNEIPECMNPHVGGHYSAAGLEALGKSAGTALGRYACSQNHQK